MSAPEIIVVHRRDFKNIGDISCAPSRYGSYFPWLEGAFTIDLGDVELYADRLSEANVIWGGGGILGAGGGFDEQLLALMALKPRKLICWGAGSNLRDATRVVMPPYMRRFDLVGIRDYGIPGFSWVPCVSALIPELSTPAAPRHKVVIYRHQSSNFVGLLADVGDYPFMENNSIDLRATLAFLASGETVVTNSYHGWYWATLMGRRVIVVSPFASKFYGLPYLVPIVTEGNWRDALACALAYPTAIAGCRQRSLDFGRQVEQFLGL